MGDVINLGDERLAGINLRAANLIAAIEHLRQVQIDESDLTYRYYWAIRTALDARADGTRPEDLDRDLDLEHDGAQAHAKIEAHVDAVNEARTLLRDEIAMVASSDRFVLGDKIHSPTGADLIAAAIYRPENNDISLTEVTFTEDGDPVAKTLHAWSLDREGKPMREDAQLIRYERWWGAGLRNRGVVHAVTRQIVND